MTEAEPYQLLEQQLAAANALLASKDALIEQDRLAFVSIDDSLLELHKRHGTNVCKIELKAIELACEKALAAIEAHKKGEK